MSKQYSLVLLSVIFSITCSNAVQAQSCSASISSSYTNGQFLDNRDGTITDVVNGLIWSKCTLGQTYVNATNECTGNPNSIDTWNHALQIAYQEQEGWRLPNIKELGSLVERKCIDPAIDLTVFPSTPSAVYWTNTPDFNRVHQKDGFEGRLIDFELGGEFVEDVNSFRYVRLVKPISSP